MHRTILFALIGIGSTVSAQAADCLFDVPKFDVVDLHSPDTVRIMPAAAAAAAAASVTAGGDPRAVETLKIHVEGGILRIDRIPGRHADRGAIVTIRTPALRTITLSGAGVIDADGIREDVTAQLSGSGRVNLTNVHARQLRLALSGSGSIVASGGADRLAVDLAGSGSVEATSLKTPALAIDLGGSGDVSAFASSTASIDAGGSGNIRVSGHPKCSVNKSGAARVICS